MVSLFLSSLSSLINYRGVNSIQSLFAERSNSKWLTKADLKKLIQNSIPIWSYPCLASLSTILAVWERGNCLTFYITLKQSYLRHWVTLKHRSLSTRIAFCLEHLQASHDYFKALSAAIPYNPLTVLNTKSHWPLQNKSENQRLCASGHVCTHRGFVQSSYTKSDYFMT